MGSAARTDRNLLVFSLTAVAYFGLLAIDHLGLRLDSVALGVVREPPTIPKILAVVAAFVFAAVRLLRDGQRVNAANIIPATIRFALSCLVWI